MASQRQASSYNAKCTVNLRFRFTCIEKFDGFLNLINHLSCLSFQEANEKFQQLQKVMSILGDEEKRALYDQTGVVDDDVSP